MRTLALVALAIASTAVWEPTLATAQVLQLPTFRQFSTSSSVLVPDGGTAYLGGVGSAAYGSSRRGPFGRSSGSSVGHAGVSVSATIIDHTELDRAVLAEAAARRGATVDVLGRNIYTGEMTRPTVDMRPNATPDSFTQREAAIRRKAAFLSRHTAKSGSRP